jgi:hypothetical protein
MEWGISRFQQTGWVSGLRDLESALGGTDDVFDGNRSVTKD